MSRYLSPESLEQLKFIAREAGKAIIEVYGAEDFHVESKDDDSPLTLADKRSNNVILSGLARLAEKYPVISEESAEIPYAERQNFETFWLVDPLDGTKEFIKRNGEFTVNIALVHDGRPVAGVVYVPVTGEMYSAVEGAGAQLEYNGSTRQLTAASFGMDDSALNVVCSRSHLNAETEAFIDGLKSPEKVSKGSSLKFLILATGEAHLYPRIAPTMEWDTAAAHCILEQAGGKVLDFNTREPLRYNKKDLRNPHFLATGSVRTPSAS